MAQAPQFDPDFPRELRQPPPRPVQPRPGHRPPGLSIPRVLRLVLFANCTLLLVCLAELLFLWLTPPLPGHVINMKVNTSFDNHGNPRTAYTVDFSYVLSGLQITDTQNVPPRFYNAIHANQPIAVHAITLGSQHFSEIQLPPVDLLSQRWPLWFAAVMAIVGMMIACFVLRRRGIWVSPHTLVRSGEPVFGQITNKFTQRGRGLSYWVNYTYEPPAGPTLKRSMPVTTSDYGQALKNARVLVLYDPANPRRSIIYQYAPYQAY